MTMISIPTLATQRLTLRGFTAADLDALAPIYADPEVSRYIGDGTPADRAATWRALAGMLGHWQLRGYGMWALIEQATGRLIGRAGLYNPEGWPGLEAGWLLARDRWGHGFATEAGHAVLAYAFTHVSADHLISLIHPANTASIRVAERLGERLERELDLKGPRAGPQGPTGPRLRHQPPALAARPARADTLNLTGPENMLVPATHTRDLNSYRTSSCRGFSAVA
jgi:RimJ/RimL family protein N-acetyltransferase